MLSTAWWRYCWLTALRRPPLHIYICLMSANVSSNEGQVLLCPLNHYQPRHHIADYWNLWCQSNINVQHWKWLSYPQKWHPKISQITWKSHNYKLSVERALSQPEIHHDDQRWSSSPGFNFFMSTNLIKRIGFSVALNVRKNTIKGEWKGLTKLKNSKNIIL